MPYARAAGRWAGEICVIAAWTMAVAAIAVCAKAVCDLADACTIIDPWWASRAFRTKSRRIPIKYRQPRNEAAPARPT